MFNEEYYNRLISAGKSRAAEIYKKSTAGRQQVLSFDGPSEPVDTSVVVNNDDPSMRKVWCSKTSCRNFTLQPKSVRTRWTCATHTEQDAPKLYYRGNVYIPHYIGEDGVAFKLRNGNTITLDPSKVEWFKRQ